MSDTKFFSLPDNNNVPAWLPFMNGGFGGFGNGGWGAGVIGFFLGALMSGGWNGGGLFGGGNNTAMLSQAQDFLMQAINSKGDLQAQALSQLSTTLNADFALVQSTFNSINTQLCNISNQIGTSALQTQNAMCQGFAGVQSTLASNAAADALAICNQTNALTSGANANTQAILGELRGMQTQALQDKLDAERNKNTQLSGEISQYQQNQYIAGAIANAVAPLNAQLAAINHDVESIKRCQPATITLPNNAYTAVPTLLANAGADFVSSYWANRLSAATNQTTDTTTGA